MLAAEAAPWQSAWQHRRAVSLERQPELSRFPVCSGTLCKSGTADERGQDSFNPNIKRSSISDGAYKRRLRGEPVDYEARAVVLV